MKKKFILATSLGLLACGAFSPLARAADVGLDGNSVYAYLKSSGYVADASTADQAAHRKEIIQPKGVSGGTTRPVSDADLGAALTRIRRTFPAFDQYPAYVQDSLLDAQTRGDFSTGGTEPAALAINANDWSAAAKTYAAQPGASDADAQSFARYAKDKQIEQTWTRAVAVGAASFGNDYVKTTDAYAANKQLQELGATDKDNRERFVVNTPVDTSIPPGGFQFTVPSSTHGFQNIFVSANHLFNFTVLDRHVVDGDIETIRFVNGAGTQIDQTITLTHAGQSFSATVARGANELRIVAQNQGSEGVNSGGVRITSPVISGAHDQNVGLLTGQTAVLRITGK